MKIIKIDDGFEIKNTIYDKETIVINTYNSFLDYIKMF